MDEEARISGLVRTIAIVNRRGVMMAKSPVVLGAAISFFCICANGYAGNVSVAERYFDQPSSHWLRNLRNHSVDDQVDIVFYGNQFIHPPMKILSECFAFNGAQGVAVLSDRLERGVSDSDTRDIARMLRAMQRMGTYDVGHDSVLMQRLKDRIDRMNDGWFKDLSVEMCGDIRSTSPSPTFADGPGSFCQ